MLTFDKAYGPDGQCSGMKLPGTYMKDGKAYDSTGAFLVNELTRLDPIMHAPLMNVEYDRDIPFRSDVTMADDNSSFMVETFGSAGSLGTGNSVGNGKHWIGKNTTAISGVSVDSGVIVNPLRPWAIELAYSIFELESSAKLQRPIDMQKLNALKKVHELEADEQAYIGDIPNGDPGLLTQPLPSGLKPGVTPVNVAVGAAGFTSWSQKTYLEILQDINTAVVSTWTASGYAVMPEKILLPPVQYGAISTAVIGAAGSMSILAYIKKFSVTMAKAGKELDIQPVKWLAGAGVGGTIGTPGIDRMVVYTQREEFVRFPYVPMQRMPTEFRGINHITEYYGKMGVVEVVYPQTISYWDGL